MVAITARLDDLESLMGIRLPRDNEELNELLYYVKCELVGSSRTDPLSDDSELQIEDVDTNRPDIWCPEGIARALSGIKGKEIGLRRYRLSAKIATDIHVDMELQSIRPFIACFVAQGARLSDWIIRGLIQLQEKLDYSYGRRRKRSSIGFYDFDLIQPPLRYGAAAPEEIRFVPLEGTEQLSLREILEKHPKGIEYGYTVIGHEKFPILLDSQGKVLSFPPIINSNDLGRITPDTRNVLVEVTGTSEDTVLNVLTILATTLADRGATIHPAGVHYNYGKPRRIKTPVLKKRQVKLKIEEARKLMGLNLSPSEIVTLLRRSRYDASASSAKTVTVSIPSYRLDILHSVDIIEDIAIAYGLNRVRPRWPSDLTIGGLSSLEEFSDTIRELVIGSGFQEVLTFMMTNQEKLFTKMNQTPSPVVEVSNPKVSTLNCLRSWLLPSLMDFLAGNTHVEYPQRLFEVGDCTVSDSNHQPKDIRELACVSAHAKANFTEMKSHLEPFLMNLGIEFTLESASNPSFLEGRVGTILIGEQEVGVIGEVHPQVLENWNLEDPVAAMEVNLGALFATRAQ
jgi:phenylalanyl-tRNA synthetase beta chain